MKNNIIVVIKYFSTIYIEIRSGKRLFMQFLKEECGRNREF